MKRYELATNLEDMTPGSRVVMLVGNDLLEFVLGAELKGSYPDGSPLLPLGRPWRVWETDNKSYFVSQRDVYSRSVWFTPVEVCPSCLKTIEARHECPKWMR